MRLPRLYSILDGATLAGRQCPIEIAGQAMVEGGASLLQLRHKGHWTRAVFDEAVRLAQFCREQGVPLIINDRADIAMLLGAGLHVGQDDLAPSDARRLVGPNAILGLSTHTAEQLASAVREPVTYVAIGPIFATSSKINPDPVVGLEHLRSWRALVQRPLVAIGGITRQNALAVLEAGADSVAVVRDIVPEPCTGRAIRERMEEWQRLLQT